MTYLLIGSMVVLAVALWHKWANKIDEESESARIIREARARAASRGNSRAYRDTEPVVDWDMASQVQTVSASTHVPDVKKLSNEEALTVSLILADVKQLPTVDTSGLVVSEIDMNKEYWDKYDN